MKIGFLIPSFYPATAYGGPIFASWYLAKALGARGHRVHVSTTNANLNQYLTLRPNWETEVAQNVFVTYYHDTVLNRLSLRQLLALEADITKTDIVHVHSIFNILAPVAAKYALLRKKPVLLTPHGSLCADALARKSSYKQLWLRSLIRPIATQMAWHATSAQEANDITTVTGVSASNVHIVRHGLPNNLPPPNPLDRQAFFAKFAPDRAPGPIIASMGRLERNKGFDILIRALPGIRDRVPGATLFIAGPDQGERPRLTSLATQLDMANHVVFLDFLGEQDRSDFFGNADLFALASHHENFGLVYAEALALGTPIVATKNTPWEGVDDAGCGRWVACDVRAMEGAIRDLLLQDRQSLRQAALAYAQRFSIDDVARQIEDTYEQTILGRAA